MNGPTTIGDGPKRDATQQEIADALSGTTADGTNYADLWAASQDDDAQD